MSARVTHKELLALEDLELARADEEQADLLVSIVVSGSATPRVLTKPVAIAKFRRRPSIKWLPAYERDWSGCGLCNVQDPPLFDVPDVVWGHYVPRQHRKRILCIACWCWLTDVVDSGRFETRHGGPLPLWSDAWRERHRIPTDTPCPLSDGRLKDYTIQYIPARRSVSP